MVRQDILNPVPRFIVKLRSRAFVDVAVLQDPAHPDWVILEGPRWQRWRVRFSAIEKVSRLGPKT